MEIVVDKHRWNYIVYGHGPGLLIAFHGYGQDAFAYKHLAQHLEDHYTIVSVDLAFHGANASMDLNFILDQNYAKAWLDSFLKEFNRSQVGLVGFSIGSRIAMFIASSAPGRVNELWLLAPDGLPVSIIYRLLTSTWLGLRLFRRFVHKPGLARGLIRVGRVFRLLSDKTSKFFLKEIESEAQRRQLFNTWIAYRNALPEFNELKNSNLAGQLAITCFLGRKDAVIPLHKTKRRLKRVFPHSAFFEADLGHNLLSEKASRRIMELVGHKKSDHKPLSHTIG